MMPETMSAAEAAATKGALIQALRERYGKAKQSANLANSIRDDTPIWLLWKSRATNILLVPQHNSINLMISYTFDADSITSDAASRSAEKYLKRINPKLEASKL